MADRDGRWRRERRRVETLARYAVGVRTASYLFVVVGTYTLSVESAERENRVGWEPHERRIRWESRVFVCRRTRARRPDGRIACVSRDPRESEAERTAKSDAAPYASRVSVISFSLFLSLFSLCLSSPLILCLTHSVTHSVALFLLCLSLSSRSVKVPRLLVDVSVVGGRRCRLREGETNGSGCVRIVEV